MHTLHIIYAQRSSDENEHRANNRRGQVNACAHTGCTYMNAIAIQVTSVGGGTYTVVRTVHDLLPPPSIKSSFYVVAAWLAGLLSRVVGLRDL